MIGERGQPWDHNASGNNRSRYKKERMLKRCMRNIGDLGGFGMRKYGKTIVCRENRNYSGRTILRGNNREREGVGE